MSLFGLLAIILATWRLSHLFVHEAGPFNMFTKLRELFGIQHDVDGDIQMIPDKLLPQLFSCIPCISIWMAGIIYLIWWIEPIPIYILAASAGAMVVNNIRK